VFSTAAEFASFDVVQVEVEIEKRSDLALICGQRRH
jgi:hypothetical protein